MSRNVPYDCCSAPCTQRIDLVINYWKDLLTEIRRFFFFRLAIRSHSQEFHMNRMQFRLINLGRPSSNRALWERMNIKNNERSQSRRNNSIKKNASVRCHCNDRPTVDSCCVNEISQIKWKWWMLYQWTINALTLKKWAVSHIHQKLLNLVVRFDSN